MIDRTCFAYYSSNNSFCSTQALSTSLVENVFFLFAGNARLHEKHRLFFFFLLLLFFFSFFFLFCRALNKQNNITNTWEFQTPVFSNVPGHITHLDRSRMDTERKNDIPSNTDCCHYCRFVGM